VTDRARREAEAPATLGVTAPTGSVTYGAAGVAYYLHRVAALRGDPDLLARADLWATRAAARADDASWYSEALGITAPVVGPNGLHHSIAGAHCVRALVLSAMGDARGAAEAALDFVAASAEPTEFTDVTLGRAGTLLGCALLVEASGGPDAAGSAPLVAFGDGIERGVRAALARSPAEVPSPSLASAPEAGYAGIAHGEGGLLYALLRWAAAVGRAPDAALDDRLAALAGRGVPLGRGVAWWWRTGGEAAGEEAGLLPGWCNGSAGFVHLWTLAHRAFGRDAYARAAEGAAWHAWEDAARPVDLCCGLAGRAYALLALHEHAGDVRWLQRAVRLANAAAEGARHAPLVRGSLYKGEVGIALLCAELEGSAPVRACMPMFGSEGWGWERPAAAPRPLGR
jgi:serine/threonine-protein kinase